MDKGELRMSLREADRLRVLERVAAGVLRQRLAARELGLSVRQVKRLMRRYRREGAAGLVSRRRGRPSNRRLPDAVRQSALEQVRAHYADFGPTLAQEYLADRHRIVLSVESLRQLMRGAGLSRTRAERARLHARRQRRPRFGELIQIDGSPHAWFENRAERCTLLVFVDDATSRITYARFVAAETTRAYLDGLRVHLACHGRPLSFYSDRHSIFIPTPEPQSGTGQTQFGRVLAGLQIELICALSPQAKGRVERAHQTLQDRLVKALRLEKISTVEAANVFLDPFLADYNRRFAVAPVQPEDAHRTVTHTPAQLDELFCLHHVRKLSGTLTLQFERTLYQVLTDTPGRRLRHAAITLLQDAQGSIRLRHQGRDLPYRVLTQHPKLSAIADRKTLDGALDRRSSPRTRPRPNHPWKRGLKLLPARTATGSLNPA